MLNGKSSRTLAEKNNHWLKKKHQVKKKKKKTLDKNNNRQILKVEQWLTRETKLANNGREKLQKDSKNQQSTC